jgi:alpha-galactosidase
MGKLKEKAAIYNPYLHYDLTAESGLKAMSLLREAHASWVSPDGSPDFIITANGKELDGSGMRLISIEELHEQDQKKHLVITLKTDSESLLIESHMVLYEGTAVMEKWLKLTNTGAQIVEVSKMHPLALHIPKSSYQIMYYNSSWGKEFDQIRKPLENDFILQTQSGRSSNEQHPWFTLFRDDGELITAAAMWSGNWKFCFEKKEDGGYLVSGGLSDWEFYSDLKPGETLESVHVVIAFGGKSDLNQTSVQLTKVGRKQWYPRNAFSQSLPIEWNPWWPYEDNAINERVFRENVDVAAKLGIEVCTLDAGWFGPAESSAHWYDYRGDWSRVNTERFPSGIRALADYVHNKGMKFGLWCEIEALGKKAAMNEQHPDFAASLNEESLGYICLGNPMAQEWAYQTLDELITEYNCDWIKLDFNLDPKSGCNRDDHGHGKGNGLFEHYKGYYDVLDRVREKHPEIILENCASGGLRIDLGILRHTHCTFLSDADWPEHDLQIFWGASTMLAPDICLHWGWSEWIEQDQGGHPHQNFNPRDPELLQHQLDYYALNGMLGGFGLSQKLPELPDWVMNRYIYLIDIYKKHVRPFVSAADLYRLTDQPRREGLGERWAAFQYVLPEKEDHLLFIFRLHGGEQERTIFLQMLNSEMTYTLTWLLENNRSEKRTGAELMNQGLFFGHLREEEAALIRINRS